MPALALAGPVAASPYQAPPLPLCHHCGLPLGRRQRQTGDSYCCTGCALAHRVTGGAEGHGRATGLLMAVGVGAFLAMNVMMLSFVLYSDGGESDQASGEAWVRWALLLLATPALVLLGGPFLGRGLTSLRERRLDTDALILVGVSAAYLLSARSVLLGHGPLYLDTAMGILLFVTLGRYLEAAARARTTDALQTLVQQMPVTACRVDARGEERQVAIAELAAGDRVRVRPGERIPADGRVEAGEASVSQAEITGEPAPLYCRPGSTVAACTLNLDGDLILTVARTGSETTVARILRLVEEARASGYPLAPLVDRVAGLFVPLVALVALATFGFWSLRADTGVALLNTLSVLLIACPCAIGIATPLVATVAAGRAASAGVLVRSGQLFERLARARSVFFDKTGTLTTGEMRVTAAIAGPGVALSALKSAAAALAAGSEHPASRALRELDSGPRPRVSGFRAVPGRGVEGEVWLDGTARQGKLGSAELIASVGAALPEPEPGKTLVHLSLDGAWQGSFILEDKPRPSAGRAVAALAARGLGVELLSGDNAGSVAAFAAGIPGLAAAAGLSPQDKLERVRCAAEAGQHPIMVGDGINDAPALSSAAVAVTLASGTDLARELADVTLLGGDLSRLPWLITLAERTLAIARGNLIWAFSYNSIGIGLAVAGLLHPLFGAVGMVASSLLVVLRSQRLARFPLPQESP